MDDRMDQLSKKLEEIKAIFDKEPMDHAIFIGGGATETHNVIIVGVPESHEASPLDTLLQVAHGMVRMALGVESDDGSMTTRELFMMSHSLINKALYDVDPELGPKIIAIEEALEALCGEEEKRHIN